jgi:hypothetical protein
LDALETELVAAIAASRYYARRNYILGYLVAGTTVLSSIAAGLTVSLPMECIETLSLVDGHLKR